MDADRHKYGYMHPHPPPALPEPPLPAHPARANTPANASDIRRPRNRQARPQPTNNNKGLPGPLQAGMKQ